MEHSPPDKKKLIAARIREIRNKKGWSQQQLANLLDIEKKQIWRVENGENYTIETLIRILDVFEMSLAEFFGGID